MTTRRWNGWGDDSVEEHVPERAMALLRELVGPSSPPVDATLETVVGARAIYDELFRDVYLRMYPRLQPLYRSIRRITGYPSA